MKTKFSSREIIAASVFVVAIIIAGVFITKDQISSSNLDKEKIKNEVLLSEKLKLAKDIEKLKKDASSFQSAKNNYEARIHSIQEQLKQNGFAMADQKRKSESIQAQLNGSIENLKKERETLNQQLKEVNQTLAALQLANQQLAEQLSQAQKENDEMNVNLAMLKAMLTDNYCTEAVRGKANKTTSRARWTEKLMISFDLPKGETQNINFTITAPDGKTYSANDKSLGSVVIESDLQEVATLDNMIKPNESERLMMSFKPAKKLAKGNYHFNIYNNDKYIGSTQLKLR
ncbi:MAG: hypothetical protein ACERKD_21865 [Prolixibacteraceae bacterium]